MSQDTSPIILGFSGDLDSSFCVPWLQENYGRDVITVCVDTGGIDAATAQTCLDESLMITAKLPSGYHRDLQRLKSPLFRAIDLAVESVDIMAYALEGLQFLPDNIKLDDGISFREAYRQVARRYAK